MRKRKEDEIFLEIEPILRPAFAEAAAKYVTENNLTVDLPYRQGGVVHLVNPYEDQVARLFTHAFLDFCRRDGGTTERTYRRKAKALRAALAELDVCDPASNVLYCQWDFQQVIKPALEAQADAFEQHAAEHGRYRKNITFERCVRDRFTGHPIPKPALVHTLAVEIEKGLRPVSPRLADKIKKSAVRESREVRRLLQGG